MHEGITTAPVTIASEIGKWNKKDNHGFFLLPSLRAEPPFEIEEGWVSPSIVLGSVWEAHSPLYWSADLPGVMFIPVPQRTILAIGSSAAVINVKEGQVLDAAAYISVTICTDVEGWLTPWMTRSLILNDAKSSPKRRRRSLLVLNGQTFWLEPVVIKERWQSQSSALDPSLRSRCQATLRQYPSHRIEESYLTRLRNPGRF